jgi:hypothetical protein
LGKPVLKVSDHRMHLVFWETDNVLGLVLAEGMTCRLERDSQVLDGPGKVSSFKGLLGGLDLGTHDSLFDEPST